MALPSYRQPGFTLVEMIIYIGIVSMILVSITYLAFDIFSGQTSSYAGQEVNYNARFLTRQLQRDIAAASNIVDLTGDAVRLQVESEEIMYLFDAQAKTLTRQVGMGDVKILSTDAVEVTGQFTDASFHDRTQSVSVVMRIAYKNPNQNSDYDIMSDIAFSSMLHGRR